MELFLSLLSGICWTIVYIEMIRKGFKEKTYGMPAFALALNIGWEALYSYLYIKTNLLDPQTLINITWLLLDLVIVYTYLKFGKKEFSKHVNEKLFIPWNLLIFVMCLLIQCYFYKEFGDLGPAYSAFLQNLIMSILFINMLVTRENVKGQSLTISICKWIGTLAPTIVFGVIRGNQLVLLLGIFCSVFDILYIYLLSNAFSISKKHQNDSTLSS